MPRVSIIMPTYNQARFIAEAIQSVLNQTIGDFELIVVDDGSTDNTREIVAGFTDPRIRYIHQENRGVSAAQNTGLKARTGEYISFMASDDIKLPKNLEIGINYLVSHPDIAIVFSDMYRFDSETGASLGRIWQDRSARYWRELQDGTRLPLEELFSRDSFSNSFLAHHDVFSEVGVFDESLPNGNEDFDFYVRALMHLRVGFVNQPLCKYRIHQRNLSGNYEQMYRGRLAVINKLTNEYSFSKDLMKLVRKRLAHTHFEYGWEKIKSGDGAGAGREKVLESLRVNPWNFRTYVYLVLSWLGSRAIRTALSWKKRLTHNPLLGYFFL